MAWGLALQRIPAVSAPRARLRSAGKKPIARTRAADTALPRISGPDAGSSDLSANAPELRRLLLAWWDLHGRHAIPWKLRPDGSRPADGEVIDPYGVFVAEVMLQQTQLAVVLPYWQRWMEAFPSLQALAEADEHAVLLLWQGLGYYSRARRLQQGSRLLLGQARTATASGSVVEPPGPHRPAPPTVRASSPAADAATSPEADASPPALSPTVVSAAAAPGTIWPQDLAGWLELPGIGRSTAGSILSSAFDRPAPILDGNVKRVLARLEARPLPPARDQALLWQRSEQLLDPLRPRAFNQALMDLGALVCTPRRPACDRCPWRAHCAAYAAGEPAAFPVKDAPRTVPFQVIGVGVVLNDAGEVLIDQRREEGLLGGLWEFPGGKQEPGEAIEATIVRELREELAIEAEVGEELISLEHAYSNKRLRFVVHLCRWIAGEPQPLASQQVRWVCVSELDTYPFPAANARIIEALRQRLDPAAAA